MGRKKKKTNNNPGGMIDKSKEENKSKTNDDHETYERKIHDLNQIIVLDSIRIREAESEAKASAIHCMNVVTELKDKKKNIDHLYEAFNKFIDDTSVKIISYETQLVLEEKVDRLESENKNLNDQISDLNEQLNEVKNEVKDVVEHALKAIRSAEEQVIAITEECEDLKLKISKLEVRNIMSEKELNEVKNESDDVVKHTLKAIQSADEKVLAITEECEDLKRKISELEAQNVMSDMILEKCLKELKSSEADNKSLRDEVKAKTNEADYFRVQISDLQLTNTSLRDEISGLKEELKELKNESVESKNKVEDQVKARTNETTDSRDQYSEMKLVNTNKQIEEQ